MTQQCETAAPAATQQNAAPVKTSIAKQQSAKEMQDVNAVMKQVEELQTNRRTCATERL